MHIISDFFHKTRRGTLFWIWKLSLTHIVYQTPVIHSKFLIVSSLGEKKKCLILWISELQNSLLQKQFCYELHKRVFLTFFMTYFRNKPAFQQSVNFIFWPVLLMLKTLDEKIYKKVLWRPKTCVSLYSEKLLLYVSSSQCLCAGHADYTVNTEVWRNFNG